MDFSIGARIAHAWSAFTSRDPTGQNMSLGLGYSFRPDRVRFTRGNEKSIVTSMFNRIAIDAAGVSIRHCRLDKDGRYKEDMDSELNRCLTLEANIDQTGRAFIQDVVMSMLDEGCVAIVPVDTISKGVTANPALTDSYDVTSMRTGKIVEWYPKHVKVRLYNDSTGEKEEILFLKKTVGIVENPLYAIVNEPNSNTQRLVRKLSLLDISDEKVASGKLDLIVQLPYVVRTPTRRKEAESRIRDIEEQLANSKYGVAYTEGTEKVIQLNRSVENNLLKQIELLTATVYSQLGITEEVLNGTADEKTMLNYYNRTIEPIVSAIVDELKRKFLSKTAMTQGQTIAMFRDPFRLVPIDNIAEIADKFTRNEIMTSNEIRQVIGMKPSSDPKADQLRNRNISQPEDKADNRKSTIDLEKLKERSGQNG